MVSDFQLINFELQIVGKHRVGKMHRSIFSLVIFSTFLFLAITTPSSCLWSNYSSSTECSKHQREALLTLKEGVGDPKNILSSWMKGSNCCGWRGVGCDYITGEVVTLNISCGNLNGTLNEGLFELKSLKYLDLSGNTFTGSIPETIHHLKGLTYLNLSFSGFSGIIPRQLGNLSHLQFMDLSASVKGHRIFGKFQVDEHLLKSEALSWLKNMRALKHLSLSGIDLGMVQGQQWGESVAHLYNLQSLDLSLCNLSGAISSSIANFSFLTRLSLYGNQLSGGISPALAQVFSLTYLDLSDNQLNGSIPSSLTRLSQLDGLDLSYNTLDGSILLSLFQNLTRLSYLSLSRNRLTVNIPPNWIPPFNLTVLKLNGCNIGGVIPPFLSTQYTLNALHLSDNNLMGSIPTWLWNLPLQTLDLSQNNLTGQLVDLIPNSAHSIQFMDLHSNHFTGFIPMKIGAIFPDLTYLAFSSNNLSGIVPSSIGNMKSLKILCLSDNKLYGKIPSALGNCSALQALKLAKNSLTGGIPMEVWNLRWLQTLHLSENRLTGALPSDLRQSTSLMQLIILNLGMNNISGHIPRWLGNLSQLRVVVLRSNCFQGLIPSEVSSLKTLQILDLSQNNLSGPIPAHLGMLTAMTDISQGRRYWLQNLSTIGYYMEEVQLTNKAKTVSYTYDTILPLITSIDLSQNHLIGTIPLEIEKLNGLITLNLSWNSLSGTIPDVFGTAMQLESLDLSRNELSGQVPTSLQMPGSLGVLNLSYNRLSGRIPDVRHLDTFGADSYVGNPNLCGRPLNKSCSAAVPPPTLTEDDDEDEDDTESELLWYGGLLISHAMGFWGVFAVLFFKREWRCNLFGAMDRAAHLLLRTIPLEIEKLNGLITLNLSQNSLSGTIPDVFGTAMQLESMDLAHNELSGKVPTSLQIRENFKELSRRILDVFHLDTFGADSYVGNPNLYGPPLNKSCWSVVAPLTSIEDNDEDEDDTKSELLWSLEKRTLLVIKSLNPWLDELMNQYQGSSEKDYQGEVCETKGFKIQGKAQEDVSFHMASFEALQFKIDELTSEIGWLKEKNASLESSMKEYEYAFSPPLVVQPIQNVGLSTDTELQRKICSDIACQNVFL
eukprot:Gb_25753 [translate_table: standard]